MEAFPNVMSEEHDQFWDQLLIYSRWTVASSTIYGVVLYLTTSLAEPEPTNDLENGGKEDSLYSHVISAWTLVPRLFQSAFALAGLITVTSDPYYSSYAFR